MDPIDIMIMSDTNQQRIYQVFDKMQRIIRHNIHSFDQFRERFIKVMANLIRIIVLCDYFSKRTKGDMIIKFRLVCRETGNCYLYNKVIASILKHNNSKTRLFIKNFAEIKHAV